MKMQQKRTELGQAIVDAACDWQAECSTQYFIGDCCSSVPLDAIYERLPYSKHQIDGSLAKLVEDGFLMVHDQEPDEIPYRHLRLDPPSWLAWSKWKPEYWDDYVKGTEVAQDWGDWAPDGDCF